MKKSNNRIKKIIVLKLLQTKSSCKVIHMFLKVSKTNKKRKRSCFKNYLFFRISQIILSSSPDSSLKNTILRLTSYNF
jgi:hypothetical protein